MHKTGFSGGRLAGATMMTCGLQRDSCCQGHIFSSVDSHSPGLIPVLGSCKETANLTSSRESLDPKENSKEVPCINCLAL